MKTIEINLYKFDELSDEAKQTAIEKNYDLNVAGGFDWWENTYEDAKNIGLKITGFDIDRGSYCSGEFNLSANEVAANIFRDHGEVCETYKTAQGFMDEWQPVFNSYMDENHENYESSDSEDELMELENDFLKSILEDYRIILSNEYDYLTGEDAIKESLIANEYDFNEDGTIY